MRTPSDLEDNLEIILRQLGTEEDPANDLRCLMVEAAIGMWVELRKLREDLERLERDLPRS